MDKVEEVAVRLKEEVDLLYFIEKDVSLIKEELNQVMEVKKKFEEREKERKQMREKIRKIQKISVFIIAVAIAGAAVFFLAGCDAFLPSLDEIVNSSTEGPDILSSSWKAEEGTSGYTEILIDSQGKVTAILSSRGAEEGMCSPVSNVIEIGKMTYSFSLEESVLTLTDLSTAEILRFIRTE